MNTASGRQVGPGLVMSPGPSGWWDSERLSSPQVMREADGRWKMWYYGRDPAFDRSVMLPSGRCGLAVSDDGIHWDRVRGPLTMGAVLEPSPPESNRFDNAHVGVSDVYAENGLYWMWFFGGTQEIRERRLYSNTTSAKGLVMRPGCAVSRDGTNWVKLDGPHAGAFLQPGPPGAFDSLFCSWPRVLRDGNQYKMYYHTLDLTCGQFKVGMAVSSDAFNWEKLGQVIGPGEKGSFDEGGISCRHVIRVDGRYLMFYEGLNDTRYYCIGLAVSEDGIHWKKDERGEQPGGPIFRHAPRDSGRWDERAVGTPYIVPMPDGSFRMYYIGANEGGDQKMATLHQIGLAVSDGPDYRKWRRWDE